MWKKRRRCLPGKSGIGSRFAQRILARKK